jgi:hypothetical protein
MTSLSVGSGVLTASAQSDDVIEGSRLWIWPGQLLIDRIETELADPAISLEDLPVEEVLGSSLAHPCSTAVVVRAVALLVGSIPLPRAFLHLFPVSFVVPTVVVRVGSAIRPLSSGVS